jgi:ubiquinone/menaquinone biosynthesis C-methylase UbiE
MAGEDHVATARDVYDLAVPRYVQFVGTEISSKTEVPIDQSLLVAFVELVKRQATDRAADVGCGPGRAASFMATRGLDVVGVDVSEAMLAVAKSAHPHIKFEEGQLDALPFETGVLAGAVCWYSIIYTPPGRLAEAFGELARVLIPGGYVLLAFQAEDEPVRSTDAHETHLPLTTYRHGVQDVAARLMDRGFEIYATVLRAPELDHETTFQGFVIASKPLS